MKIAIYEITHLELIIPLCEFFSHRSDTVFFFSDEAFENDLKSYEMFSFTYTTNNENRTTFRKKLHRFFKENFDLILLNSVDHRHYFLYEAIQKQKAKVIINLHDINNFFIGSFSLSPRQNIRTLGKQLLAKRANAYMVNDKAMQDYIVRNNFTNKTVHWFPQVIAQSSNPNNYNENFVVTIPGSIDQNRRDYEFVFNVLSRLIPPVPNRFELVLAGRPVGIYGDKILCEAEKLKRTGLTIRFYREEVPENLFQQLIDRSTIIWSPSRIHTSIHDQIEETYGLTKTSGNIYDAIRHGKPLLVPSVLRVPKEIHSGCVYYSSVDEAGNNLFCLLNKREKMHELTVRAHQNSQEFSLTNGLIKLDLILNAVMR